MIFTWNLLTKTVKFDSSEYLWRWEIIADLRRSVPNLLDNSRIDPNVIEVVRRWSILHDCFLMIMNYWFSSTKYTWKFINIIRSLPSWPDHYRPDLIITDFIRYCGTSVIFIQNYSQTLLLWKIKVVLWGLEICETVKQFPTWPDQGRIHSTVSEFTR